MSKLSDKHCDVCLQKGIRKKVRTLCDECREFLCQECSDAHLLFKVSRDHNLIDMESPGEESRSANEDYLVSDFLQNAKVSETTVLYRAQVAVVRNSTIDPQKETKPKEEYGATTRQKKGGFSNLKPRKTIDFSVTRPDDKKNVWVTGVLGLTDKYIVMDNGEKLKLYDGSGNFLSSSHLKEITWGITRVDKEKFATCGRGNKVFLWTVRGQSIIFDGLVYDVDYFSANGIHYNSTYYCLVHHRDNAITILDKYGRPVRKIVMKEAFGKEISLRYDIQMDRDTHDIYIPCWLPNTGVLCMSVEGEALWFTTLSGADLWGITEIHGALCVADSKDTAPCLHLISKTGQYAGKLLERLKKEELAGYPYCIHYDAHGQELLVSYMPRTEKRNIISVYAV